MTKINLNTPWSDIKWNILEKDVFSLQKKIYKYSKENDLIKVYRLQKLLITSLKSKLLAASKVTQDSSGKKIVGVGKVKSISPKEK